MGVVDQGKKFDFAGKLIKSFDVFMQKFLDDLVLVIYSKMPVYPDKICHLQL